MPTLQAEAQPGYALIGIEVLVAVIVLICGFKAHANYEYPPLAYPIAAILIVGGLMGIVSLTYNRFLSSTESIRDQLGRTCTDLRAQLVQKANEYEHAIIDRLKDLAEKPGDLARITRRGNEQWLLYCPPFTAMLDFGSDEMLLINTIDCRELQLSYKELERRAQSDGTVDSRTGPSLAGAAVGGLVFGAGGLIAGSVVGSAGNRNVSISTVERSVGKYVVDVYTRLQQFPVVTLDFDCDETQAKEFYAVVSAALPPPH